MNARVSAILTMLVFISLTAVAANEPLPADKLVGKWRVNARHSAKLNKNPSMAVLFELASFNYEVDMRQDGQYAAVISGVGNGKKETGKWKSTADAKGNVTLQIVKDGDRGTQQVVIKFLDVNVMSLSTDDSTVFVMNRVTNDSADLPNPDR